MQVRALSPALPHRFAPLEKLRDQKAGADLFVAGTLFLHDKGKAHQLEQAGPLLADVPEVKMERPLVLCPGWNTELHKFDALAHKLTASGLNGETVYLKQGHAYRDPEATLPLADIPSNSKLFVNIWDSAKSPPDRTAPQLAENMKLLHGALGPGKVDMVGYSMGGLCAREYLQEGGSDVGRLMTLGTPNLGTRFGQISGRVIDHEVKWALKFSGLTHDDSPAMGWLAAGSPKLDELNAHWAEQRGRVDEYRAVGASQYFTPATGWLPFRKGDGMVETARLAPPGETAVILHGDGLLQHGSLPSESMVYREIAGFFGFTPVTGDHPPCEPPVHAQSTCPYDTL